MSVHEESTDSPIDLDSQDNNELPEEDEDDEDEEVAPAAAGTKRKRAPRHNWTSEEDLYLLRAVVAVGVGNWRHVLQHLLHRNHQYWKWCENAPTKLRSRWNVLKGENSWVNKRPVLGSVPPRLPAGTAAADIAAHEKAHHEKILSVEKQWKEANKLLKKQKKREETVSNKSAKSEAEVVASMKEKDAERKAVRNERLAELSKSVTADTAARQAREQAAQKRSDRVDKLLEMAVLLMVKSMNNGKDDAMASAVSELAREFEKRPDADKQ